MCVQASDCDLYIVDCVVAPVRPVQTSTPPTIVQKPAPAAQAQARVQTPQVLNGLFDILIEINVRRRTYLNENTQSLHLYTQLLCTLLCTTVVEVNDSKSEMVQYTISEVIQAFV